MNKALGITCVAMCALLAACGGSSGGGVASTPTPTPTNTTITDLKASQSFVNDSATSQIAYDLTSKTTISGTAATGSLTISFDAASNSYSVTVGGRQDTFSSADITSNGDGEIRYSRKSAGEATYLTLVTAPYSGSAANQYVRMAYLQRNALSGNRQDTQFGIFTYGLETAAANTPRTGSAAYTIDIFALSSFPGREPSVLQGDGAFNVDFASGDFSATGDLVDFGLVTNTSNFGRGTGLKGAGHIASGSGQFAGNVLIDTAAGQIAGTLNGRFYGPQGEELGAAFAGSNATGASLNGAFAGKRSPNTPAANLRLTNLTGQQSFAAPAYDLNVATGFVGGTQVGIFDMVGSALIRLDAQSYTLGPGNSGLPGFSFSPVTYTAADAVPSSDPNFTAYRKTTGDQTILLELYKPGPSNTQLALTYASFGRWFAVKPVGVTTYDDKVFFAYGFETPAGLLSARTGSGRYDGVIIGAGANKDNGNTYEVAGTSRIDVDFSNQSYTGALTLQGKGTNGTASIDFGSYGFGAPLSNLAESRAALTALGIDSGVLRTRFYGPDGEEIGGTFFLKAPVGSPGAGTTISGATVARRQ